MFKDYTEKAKLDFCLQNEIEFWKEIPGYDGIYSISTFGNVRNNETGKMLKPQNCGAGYLEVSLWKDKKLKRYTVHRLVLNTFVGPCPEDYEADHRDMIKTNNKLENLHWVSKSQNNRNKTTNKSIEMFDLDGQFIRSFDTIVEAVEELDLPYKSGCSNISGCCKNKVGTAYGYIWRYANED